MRPISKTWYRTPQGEAFLGPARGSRFFLASDTERPSGAARPRRSLQQSGKKSRFGLGELLLILSVLTPLVAYAYFRVTEQPTRCDERECIEAERWGGDGQRSEDSR